MPSPPAPAIGATLVPPLVGAAASNQATCVEHLRHLPKKAALEVIPHRGQSIECLMGVYPRALAPLAAARVAAGRLRVREFAALAEGSGHAMRWEIPQQLLPEFRNWNTAEDVGGL
jgi:molybdopterin-guanine dinucleotide biosynthesis protein A